MDKTSFNTNYFKLCEFASENELLKEKLQKEQDFYKRNLLLANIPIKYWKFEWEKIHDDLALNDYNEEGLNIINYFLNNIEEKFNEGKGLYIFGGHGTSKTTTAIIVLKEAMKQHYTGFYVHSTDVFEYVANGWNDPAKKEYWEYITKKINFLVIDDIARNFKMTEREQQLFDKLFIYRSNNCLPTIFTTNLDKTSMKDKVGDALISLFNESLENVKFVGDDIRKKG